MLACIAIYSEWSKTVNQYLLVRVTSIFLSLMFITRCFLWGYAYCLDQVVIGNSVIAVFIVGAFYDLCTVVYIAPLVLGMALIIPRKAVPALTFFAIMFLILTSVGEILFWDEFGVRFNFIAVDYLIYMDEVTKNIYESYPVIKVGLIAFIIAGVISKILCKQACCYVNKQKELIISLGLIMAVYFVVDDTTIELNNRYENELAHNGIYNVFSAFKNNSLDYPSFYQTIDNDLAFNIVKHNLGVNNAKRDSISRFIDNGRGNGYNVVLIVVESLSAEYMNKFGNDHNLTPFLDSLSKKSLFFSNFYATGTRTVRGLEAITLSMPPTPGNSIVRRKNNEGLFSLGSVLNQHHYYSKFFYGGYGYFDNMSHFFEGNGFIPIDRTKFNNDEITFANAWGVADEDVYRKAIAEADKDFADNKKFFYFIMTTSNHRPFTYPDGKVNTPSGQGRNGAVQYTDFAIKTLLTEAKNKPWFDNTIFVITADHCAGSAGKNDLPLERYRIPLMIYAPKIIKSKEVFDIASQIDIAPTILSIMGVSYESKFYGVDILKKPANRALLGTYQKLGYYTPGDLVILGPKEMVAQYRIDGSQTLVPPTATKVNEAISFYQTAHYMFSKGLMKAVEK